MVDIGGTKCSAEEVAIAIDQTGVPKVKTRCWWKYHVAELPSDVLQFVVTKPWVTEWGGWV